jgi:hypothetical protein
MIRFLLTGLILTLAALPAAASQGIILYPLSYSKPIPGGQYLFVMLGDASAEQKERDDASREKFRELRTKYPRTGLYRVDTGEPVWVLEDDAFAPAPCVFLTSDGVHLVRIDGDWWTTDAFVGGPRPSADVQRQQLDAPGVTFFVRGKVLRRHAVRDLVVHPDDLPHTPQHLLWYANGTLNENTSRFLMNTQDSHRQVFDYRTGELLEVKPAGLGNPLFRTILIICGVGSALILATWAWLVFFRRRPQPAAIEPPG